MAEPVTNKCGAVNLNTHMFLLGNLLLLPSASASLKAEEKNVNPSFFPVMRCALERSFFHDVIFQDGGT